MAAVSHIVEMYAVSPAQPGSQGVMLACPAHFMACNAVMRGSMTCVMHGEVSWLCGLMAVVCLFMDFLHGLRIFMNRLTAAVSPAQPGLLVRATQACSTHVTCYSHHGSMGHAFYSIGVGAGNRGVHAHECAVRLS